MKTPTLYHFTCYHGHAGISKTSTIVPNLHPLMRNLGPLIWLTSEPEPTRESAGLTSRWIRCDRMAYRYIVQPKAALHWREIRDRAPREIVQTLESFSRPETWYIARRPLLASEFSFDATWQKQEVSR